MLPAWHRVDVSLRSLHVPHICSHSDEPVGEWRAIM